MNMASEATLATELELRYAHISTVDSYARDIVEKPREYKDIVAAATQSLENLERVLVKVVEGVG
jgi:purine nucleoside phosphorylase